MRKNMFAMNRTTATGRGKACVCRAFPLLLLSLLAACSAPSGPTPGEIAAQTAKTYYDQLLRGDYEGFVGGSWQPDSIPAGYHEQLVANARMFVGQQLDEHKGIKEVHIASAQADTARHSASVFLLFAYGDSTTEEVVVPMVEHGSVWYMR